ncbi:MAG: clan AA aspartic protease [Bacteroidota bacterium]|nr:clan AA aspartic protease [Bacteroidota bacterium]
MGLVYADIEIINYADETLSEDGYLPKENIRKMQVTAMADSGAIRLAINENIKDILGLRVRQQLNISLADGTKRTLDVAGPIRLKFKDRHCITDAFVLPNNEEPLIGAVPMELMDLVIIPSENKLVYNPLHPDGPLYSLK